MITKHLVKGNFHFQVILLKPSFLRGFMCATYCGRPREKSETNILNGLVFRVDIVLEHQNKAYCKLAGH